MKRAYLNYITDAGMLVAFIITFFTGIVKWPGLILHLGFSYKTFPMAYFTAAHDWGGMAMAVFCLMHLVLHRKWISCMTKKILRGNRNEKRIKSEITSGDVSDGECSC